MWHTFCDEDCQKWVKSCLNACQSVKEHVTELHKTHIYVCVREWVRYSMSRLDLIRVWFCVEVIIKHSLGVCSRASAKKRCSWVLRCTRLRRAGEVSFKKLCGYCALFWPSLALMVDSCVCLGLRVYSWEAPCNEAQCIEKEAWIASCYQETDQLMLH